MKIPKDHGRGFTTWGEVAAKLNEQRTESNGTTKWWPRGRLTKIDVAFDFLQFMDAVDIEELKKNSMRHNDKFLEEYVFKAQTMARINPDKFTAWRAAVRIGVRKIWPGTTA